MKAADPSVNPHYYLAAYGITSDHPWMRIALSRGALVDLTPRAPTVDDVLDRSTLRLLPKRVRLQFDPNRPR